MKRAAMCFVAMLSAAACGGGSSTAPTGTAPPPAQVPGASHLAADYANELLNIMQTGSINRDRINWTDFRSQVIQRAAGAQTIADLYPAISLALGLLNDHHSFYQVAAGGGIGNPNGLRCGATPVGGATVPPDVGYVRVPSFSSSVGGADRAFADAIQEQIQSRDAVNLAGWIVDVRGNGGGNMWPMIAGLGPVLGDGVAGYFVAPTGVAVEWSVRNGAALNGTTEIVRTTTPYALLAGALPRVAILIDNLVASSGEAVVVSFRGRPNARSFGAATCGLSTANSGFRLSDGATLQLTTALMADRARVSYGVPIAPDDAVNGDGDVVVQRAIGWLRGE